MAVELGVGEGDAAEGAAQDIARRGGAVAAEVEAGSGSDIGVAPSIEDDPRDVAPRVEAGVAAHRDHLLANGALVVAVASREEIGAAGELMRSSFKKVSKAQIGAVATLKF